MFPTGYSSGTIILLISLSLIVYWFASMISLATCIIDAING
jgi:hypothetical protein